MMPNCERAIEGVCAVHANDKYCEIAGRPLDEVSGIRPRDLGSILAIVAAIRPAAPVQS